MLILPTPICDDNQYAGKPILFIIQPKVQVIAGTNWSLLAGYCGKNIVIYFNNNLKQTCHVIFVSLFVIIAFEFNRNYYIILEN